MRVLPISLLLSSLAATALSASAPSQQVVVNIRREPAEVVKAGGLEPSETRTIPLSSDSCAGVLSLRAIDYTLRIRQHEKGLAVEITAEATIDKSLEGPLAAPVLIIQARSATNAATLTHPLEAAMTSSGWERGGRFRESFVGTSDTLDANFWQSAELRCSAASPYRVAVIPEDVTYTHRPDGEVGDAITQLEKALRSERGFGTAALYNDEMTLIGPALYAAIKEDPALAVIKSPKVLTVDPSTGASRPQLRVKGSAELNAFADALRRHVGERLPRIRAATSAEAGEHWLNIGWDIVEPLLVLDYGGKRLILDYSNGKIMMIDELTSQPTNAVLRGD